MNNYIIKYILPNGKLFATSYVKAESISDKRLDDATFLGFTWYITEFARADIYIQYTGELQKVKSYDYQEWKNNVTQKT